MHRDGGEIKLSYFGRVTEAYVQQPRIADKEVLAVVQAEEGTLDSRSKRMIGERLLAGKIKSENIVQLYNMALQIAVAVLRESVLQGSLTTPPEHKKRKIQITLLSISYQLRAEIVRQDLDTVAVMNKLGASIELQEQDKEFTEKLVDAAFDDAILSLLQTHTAERAAATIQ
jgi:hypothetical protein